MTLDIARIIAGLSALAAEQDAERDTHRFTVLRESWATFDAHDVEQRLASARQTFLVARRCEEGAFAHPAPPIPHNHTVIATDGSMILPSRHSPARFFVLNTGLVRLTYGEQPSAHLSAQPLLFSGDDAMTIPNDVRRTPQNETTIGLMRAVHELCAAGDLAEASSGPTLALQDGTLILWRLESQSDVVRTWILDDFARELGRFEDLGIPLASYISAPGATELMNMLRIAVCDYPLRGLQINCDHCRGRVATEGHTPACDVIPAVTDRALLSEIATLPSGARTPVFRSMSRILSEYVKRGGPGAEIRFFYINTGREIARVEAPRYVTDDTNMLDFVHAAILEQSRLGRGYPVALQEAHEQAVISMDDRRVVELAVEQALARAGVVLTWTGKDGSKRGRFV